ncbi:MULTISPECIES: TIGR01777 family oxidoreductase [Paenibacillus]|uniref:TIGR01777 family oxidoreductase n=1 Tax=Paenibacillus TaxID=44249 RepID=UPI002FE04BAF
MKIAIFGGTGFIGRALTDYLLREGGEVVVVSRKNRNRELHSAAPDLIHCTWDELEHDLSPLSEVHAFVNLAGASLNLRWTPKAKRIILESRLTTTRKVAEFAASLSPGPQAVVQASAVGFYGTSLTEEFAESAQRKKVDDDFLQEVTERWEAAAEEGFRDRRLILLRTGVVLGNEGGAYPLMRLPFRLGLGGKVGTGQQWVPWIHINDIVRLIDFCLNNPAISGPINAVSPFPVTNEQFSAALGRVHRTPSWFPVPAPLLKLLLGDRAMLLLEGQKVIPASALVAGFQFTYPGLQEALADLHA